MPQYSDNLYSVDDSDTESLSDALSPTDGYFEHRGSPQNMMVEDPSLAAGSSAESKAEEARRESQTSGLHNPSSPSAPSPTISTAAPSEPYTPVTTAAYVSSSSPSVQTPRSPASSHRRTSDIYTESSSLLHPAPPPAYTPGSSPTISVAATSFNRNYSTITSAQLEEGRTPLREPESMGGPPEDFNERTPLWVKRVKYSHTRKCMKSCLLVLLVITVFISLIVTLVKTGMESDGNIHFGRPDQDGTPDQPGVPPVSGQSYCPTATIHRTNYPDFDFTQGGQLNILQTHKDSDSSSSRYVQTAGKTIFRRLPHDRKDKSAGFVSFDVWTTDEELYPEVQVDTNLKAIKAYTPAHAEGLKSGQQHCISLEITVWLPWNATFDDIQVYTTQLGIEVYDDIHVHAEHSASFEAVSGRVRFPPIDEDDPTITLPPRAGHVNTKVTQIFRRPERGITSREIRIHTASGSVDGAFSLYDLLSITTLSGSINISVSPQEANKDNNPAVLNLETKSASITARLPVFASPIVPKRDYHTSVTTLSGSIKGSYYIGSTCKISARSSSIHAALLPVSSHTKSYLCTESYSGATEIEVLSPLYGSLKTSDDWIDIGGGDPYLLMPPRSSGASIDSQDEVDGQGVASKSSSAIRSSEGRLVLSKLTSEHHSKSGSTKLLYPPEWEGRIDARSYSGHINVGGDGVRIVSNGKDWVGSKHVIAKKGESADEASSIDVRAVSGGTDIWIGPK